MARAKPLVTQHLEGISRKVLEEQQHIIREYVRRRQGIYALFRRGKLYYVGLAGNLRSRLGHHLKDRHKDSWDAFSVYLTIGDDHLRELESLILRIAAPGGNKQKGKFAKSEDLRRRFRRDLRNDFNASIDELLGGEERTTRTKRKKIRRGKKGREAVLCRYTKRAFPLRAKHKRKTLRAYVRKSGVIFFNKQHFNSPSMAAKRAVNRPTCNGWTFWQYQRSPGDWVALDNLRK